MSEHHFSYPTVVPIETTISAHSRSVSAARPASVPPAPATRSVLTPAIQSTLAGPTDGHTLRTPADR